MSIKSTKNKLSQDFAQEFNIAQFSFYSCSRYNVNYARFCGVRFPDGAGNFKSIIDAKKEDHFKVGGELKQLLLTAINHHANRILPHIKLKNTFILSSKIEKANNV